MKNLGTPLSNQELLNIKGGAYFTCHCANTGLEYVVEIASGSLAEAEATLATRCGGGGGFCEEDIPF